MRRWNPTFLIWSCEQILPVTESHDKEKAIEVRSMDSGGRLFPGTLRPFPHVLTPRSCFGLTFPCYSRNFPSVTFSLQSVELLLC